jgi:uncharacterized protein YycO
MTPPLRVVLHASDGIVGKLIRWQTRADWSHVSLAYPDGLLLEAREGRGVVRERRLSDCTEPTQVFRVVASSVRLSKAMRWAETQLDKGYDYTMVARFLTRRQETRGSTGKWFCSELAFAALLHVEVPLLARTEPWEVSPGLLARSPLLYPEDAP